MENNGQNYQLTSLQEVTADNKYRLTSLLSDRSTTDSLGAHMECANNEDLLSETTHDHGLLLSDSESCSGGPVPKTFRYFSQKGLVRLEEESRQFKMIKNKFVSRMGSLGRQINTTVSAVHRNSFSTVTGQARLQSFRIFSDAMAKKCGGDACRRYAWYGATKEEICNIIAHGFGHCKRSENGGSYGLGIYLSPLDYAIDCAASSAPDENGMRHVVLCRVLLGKMEVIKPGVEQFHPSSEEFDSGVDNLVVPKKYIIWSTHMNTHILPEYVVSFKLADCLDGFKSRVKPSSPWMPFLTLISVLSRILPSSNVNLIAKHHNDYRGKNITRRQFIQRVREIAGDKLLISVIKSYKNKAET